MTAFPNATPQQTKMAAFRLWRNSVVKMRKKSGPGESKTIK